jgi:hypothetical protein
MLCFKPDGLPNWPMTAKWLSLSLQNTVVPGDAPACDLLPNSTITPESVAEDVAAAATAAPATAEPAAVAAAGLDVAAAGVPSLMGLALPVRTTCPFYARYVYGGDLAAEIGASRCIFEASLYCVRPETGARGAAGGKSLIIGTAAKV